jgi:hypothetical protein
MSLGHRSASEASRKGYCLRVRMRRGRSDRTHQPSTRLKRSRFLWTIRSADTLLEKWYIP